MGLLRVTVRDAGGSVLEEADVDPRRAAAILARHLVEAVRTGRAFEVRVVPLYPAEGRA